MKTKQFIYFGLISIIFIMMPDRFSAQSIFDYEGITYRVIKDADEASTFGTVAVTAKNGGFYEGIVTIPNAVRQSDDEYADAYKVVSIDDFAFKGSPSLTKVVLPMTVESIGEHAFEDCDQLTQIDIPQGSLTLLGEYAFANSGLKSIRLPEGIVELPRRTFSKCKVLERVDLPQSLVRLGDMTFELCISLKNIKLPNCIKEIGNGTFVLCGLTSITLPDYVVSIPLCAFSHCFDLEEVTLSPYTVSIGMGAFSNCYSLKTMKLPKDLKKIESQAFNYSGLTSVILPDNVVSIPLWAFAYCYDLEEVTLSPHTVSIEGLAFGSCVKLSKINKPETLKDIAEGAFEDCINIPAYMVSKEQAELMKDEEYRAIEMEQAEQFKEMSQSMREKMWEGME